MTSARLYTDRKVNQNITFDSGESYVSSFDPILLTYYAAKFKHK